MAKVSPMTSSMTERLPSSNSEEDNEDGALESTAHAQQCVLPAVLRDRPPGGRGLGGRGAPPPVPPRSPRRPTEASSSRGGH